MAKIIDENGLSTLCASIKGDVVLKADAEQIDVAEPVVATPSDLLKVTSATNVSKSASASSNVNLFTSTDKYTGNVLVNATVSFPNTGGSVRSVRINGTEYFRAYPSGTGATIITIAKVLQLTSATNISVNVTHNASSSMTVTLSDLKIVQL